MMTMMTAGIAQRHSRMTLTVWMELTLSAASLGWDSSEAWTVWVLHFGYVCDWCCLFYCCGLCSIGFFILVGVSARNNGKKLKQMVVTSLGSFPTYFFHKWGGSTQKSVVDKTYFWENQIWSFFSNFPYHTNCIGATKKLNFNELLFVFFFCWMKKLH